MPNRGRLGVSRLLKSAFGFAVLFTGGSAWAQGPVPEEQNPPAGEQPAMPAPPATAPEPASTQGPVQPPATPPQAEAPALSPPPSPPVADAPAEPASVPNPELAGAPPTEKWYENLKVGVFADAYYSYNFNQPHPESGSNVGLGGPGGNLLRAYDFNNGASLHWAGIDATYAYGRVAGSVGLRLGPSTVGYNANDAPFGTQFVKQAFATWKPLGSEGPLTLDFGKYDQPFGSEVADSQLNLNYTRSLLYWLAQPLHFTGLRVEYAVSPAIALKLFLANGWNRVADNNAMKNLGGQIVLKPADEAVFYLGYMLGAEQSDVVVVAPPEGAPTGTPSTFARDFSGNTRLRHFADLVVDINPSSALRFLANADYGTEDLGSAGTASWYGANLAIGIKPTDEFLIAPRGEIYVDDNYNFGPNAKRTLYQATLTLGYLPSPNLIIKLDGRGDFMDEPFFPSKTLGALNKQQYTATLGVVATTN